MGGHISIIPTMWIREAQMRWTEFPPKGVPMCAQLLVEPGAVDLVGQDHEFMAHVDDLIETSAEKIVMPRLWLLFRSHRIPRMEGIQRITKPPKRESQTARKSQENRPWSGRFLQFQILPHAKNVGAGNGFGVLNGELNNGARGRKRSSISRKARSSMVTNRLKASFGREQTRCSWSPGQIA